MNRTNRRFPTAITTNAFGLGKSVTEVIEHSRYSYQIADPSLPGTAGEWCNIESKRKGVRLQ